MAKRSDRQARKQDKRAAKQAEKAQRRGDVLALLEAKGPLAQPEALIELLARDVESSHRHGHDARLLRIAQAVATRAELLATLATQRNASVAACGWLLLGALLRTTRFEPSERLLSAFECSLTETAPELLAWLRAYVEHRGAIPSPQLEPLARLTPASGARPAMRLATLGPGEMEQALLTSEDPEVLAKLVARIHDFEPELQAPLLQLAGRLVWRAALLLVRQHRSPRGLFGVLGQLGESNQDLLIGAIRLVRTHGLLADLREIGLLLAVAHRSPSLRPMVIATLRAKPAPLDDDEAPEPHTTTEALELGRRLLTIDPDPHVWVWTTTWFIAGAWADDREPELPKWLRESGLSLVESGALARTLADLDGRGLEDTIEALQHLPWQVGLRFVTQGLEILHGETRRPLAALATHCLRQRETTGKPKRGTVAQLLATIERFCAEHGGSAELRMMIEELRLMPPKMAVPPQLLEAFGDEDYSPLGPNQLAWANAHALELVPHDRELLHDLLHHEALHERHLEFIKAFLGTPPSFEHLGWLIALCDSHRWGLWLAYTIGLLGEHHGEDAGALALVFAALEHVRASRPLLKELARMLLGAIERGASSADVPPIVLARAARLAGKRKQAAKKKTGAKKTSSKKTGAKKTGAKKTGAKKTGAKKTSSKKTSAKKTGAKKTRQEAKQLSPAR